MVLISRTMAIANSPRRSRKEISRYELHRVKVQSLYFSSNKQYLVSLGGKDCGSIIVYDIEQNITICGTIATKETTGDALKVCDRINGGRHSFPVVTKTSEGGTSIAIGSASTFRT